jgi:adenylosuccinate synthase
MGCNVIVGGQYGSEGKGKVVALCAAMIKEPWVVRCGGPNSGHTSSVDGHEIVLRQVPAGAGHPQAILLLSAGCAIDEEILLTELDQLRIPKERIVVDPRAVLISPSDRVAEESGIHLIGSTGSGTGAALIRRISRAKNVALASESTRLKSCVRLESVAPLLHKHLDAGGDVIIEGTQGFGLSLLHGFDYPFVTSRDTTAAGFAMEVGLSPRQVDAITLVLRTFPIRVGGNSGPLKNEISWEDVQQLSKASESFPEFTSVTKRLRRVALFDIEPVIAACNYNRPTGLAVMGIDRLDYSNLGVSNLEELSGAGKEFLRMVAQQTGVPIQWIGTGFGTWDAIHVSAENQKILNYYEATNAR